MFVYLFGPNIFAANLFSLICSLGEIALVGYFAGRYWGTRTGVIAALILSVMPLHVGAATAIHTDPIAAFAITASFIAFWRATESNSRIGFFATGLIIGFVFWVKELIVVYVAVFLLYALIERRWDWKWLFIIFGGLVLLLGHLILMWVIAGDPFHGFKVYFMQIDRDFVGGGKESAAFYYFYYLFIDIRHNWLVPYLAFAGVIVMLMRRQGRQSEDNRFLVIWLVGSLVVYSFTPISLDPFQLITKQSNYLNLFFAPLSVAAAVFLAPLMRRWTMPVMGITVFGGIMLAALGQQDLRKFVANSKAVAQFAREHPEAIVFASVNNRNVTSFVNLLEPGPAARLELLHGLTPQSGEGGQMVFVVIDGETAHWNASVTDTAEPKRCWRPVKVLEPQGFGFGYDVVEAIVWSIQLLPGHLGDAVAKPFANLLSVRPATVYALPTFNPLCSNG